MIDYKNQTMRKLSEQRSRHNNVLEDNLLLSYDMCSFMMSLKISMNTLSSVVYKQHTEIRTWDEWSVTRVKTMGNNKGGDIWRLDCTPPRGRRRQRERQKKQWAWISKTTTLHVHHASCTFLGRYCTTTTWKCLISRFVEDMNTRELLFFLFLNFNTVF